MAERAAALKSIMTRPAVRVQVTDRGSSANVRRSTAARYGCAGRSPLYFPVSLVVLVMRRAAIRVAAVPVVIRLWTD
jgi:hypothetical protein